MHPYNWIFKKTRTTTLAFDTVLLHPTGQTIIVKIPLSVRNMLDCLVRSNSLLYKT